MRTAEFTSTDPLIGDARDIDAKPSSHLGWSTSALGQKATSAGDRTKSALPPRTDIAGREREVRFVPRLCENVREQRMRRIVFSLVPLRP